MFVFSVQGDVNKGPASTDLLSVGGQFCGQRLNQSCGILSRGSAEGGSIGNQLLPWAIWKGPWQPSPAMGTENSICLWLCP